MSIDDREKQRLMIDRVASDYGRTLDFQLLSDADHAVIARYGILNQADPKSRPIPHPTTFVIDRVGVVRWKFVETDYRVRPTNEEIVAALRSAREEG